MESRKKSECHLSEMCLVLELNDRANRNVRNRRSYLCQRGTEHTEKRSKEVIVIFFSVVVLDMTIFRD